MKLPSLLQHLQCFNLQMADLPTPKRQKMRHSEPRGGKSSEKWVKKIMRCPNFASGRISSRDYGCIPLGWSGSGSLTWDHLDQGRSVDLLQVDLLASEASLVWPWSSRPRATKSRELDLSRLMGFHLHFAPKMRSGVTRIWGCRFPLRVLDFNGRMCWFHSD